MRFSRNTPSINSGSTADIAFLLLIFFLITTTIPNDKGIARKLPRPCLSPPCSEPIHERNILRVQLNQNGEILADNELVTLYDLNEILKNFIDNNGEGTCDYCQGNQLANGSSSPTKAVVSISSNRASRYKDFIAIQAEISKAYYELRTQYSVNKYNKEMALLSKEELMDVKTAYPLLLSEAEVK